MGRGGLIRRNMEVVRIGSIWKNRVFDVVWVMESEEDIVWFLVRENKFGGILFY